MPRHRVERERDHDVRRHGRADGGAHRVQAHRQAAFPGAALALTVVVVFAAMAWLINISAMVVDLIPAHSLGAVFGFVAAGSTVGGILMNTVVATMVSGPSAGAAGFVDRAVNTLCGGLLQALQGAGYGRWFVAMAFLHPLAWMILRLAGVDRASAPPAGGRR